MTDIKFKTRAYAKIILHAAKYPHCSVNGLLLAESASLKDSSKLQDLEITDSIPLFHQCLDVTPMAEVALTQVESSAHEAGLTVVGYYNANENYHSNGIVEGAGLKIAEKIAEYFPHAVMAVVDNKKMNKMLTSPALKIFQHSEGKWKPREIKELFCSMGVLETVSHLLQRSVYRDLVDFDNYLDDVKLDWSNSAIHKLLIENDD